MVQSHACLVVEDPENPDLDLDDPGPEDLDPGDPGLAEDVAERDEQRGKFSEQHPAWSDRGGYREPKIVSLKSGTNVFPPRHLPIHHRIRATCEPTGPVEVPIRHP